METVSKLFLAGLPKTGKTTLLLSMLKPYRQELGGFYVQRHIKEGFCIAYALCAVGEGSFEADAPWQGNATHSFLTKHGQERLLDLSVFESFGAKILRDSTQKCLVLLDEIGGVELLSDTFFQELWTLLKNDVPCIGVLKSEKAKLRMQRDVKRAQEIEARREMLQSLLADASTWMVDTTDMNARNTIEAFISKSLGDEKI